ncbi:MAG: hypothetical protein ACOYJ2_01025 [Rickettsiales bacterium]
MVTEAERRQAGTNIINRYTSENPNYRNYTADNINALDDVIISGLLTVLTNSPERIDEFKPTNMGYGEFAAHIFRNAARLRDERGNSILSTEMEGFIIAAASSGSGLPSDRISIDNPSALRFNGTFRVVSVSPLGECVIEFVGAQGNAQIVINGVQPEHIEALYLAREIGTDLVTRRAVRDIDQNIPNGHALLSRNTTIATIGVDPLLEPFNRYRQQNSQASEREAQEYALRQYMLNYLQSVDSARPALVGAMLGSEAVFADRGSALYQDINSTRSAAELAATMEFIFNPHDGIEPTPSTEMTTLADLARRWRENGYRGAVLGADISSPPSSLRASNDNGVVVPAAVSAAGSF